MTMLLCDPSTGPDVDRTAEERTDEATMAARAWLARELRFERLLNGWRAAGESE